MERTTIAYFTSTRGYSWNKIEKVTKSVDTLFFQILVTELELEPYSFGFFFHTNWEEVSMWGRG